MRAIFLFLLIGLLTNCHSKNSEAKDKANQNMELNAKGTFERIDDKYSAGTSLIKHRESTNVRAPIGDFLSRIWNSYDKPNGVSYEGFQYTFKDVKTGLVFTAYSAGSGPAYGGDPVLRTSSFQLSMSLTKCYLKIRMLTVKLAYKQILEH